MVDLDELADPANKERVRHMLGVVTKPGFNCYIPVC